MHPGLRATAFGHRRNARIFLEVLVEVKRALCAGGVEVGHGLHGDAELGDERARGGHWG